ncbi:MAG: hypothetical protein ACTHM1_11880 [Solirubrobacteraceae bacterium]
MPEHHQRPLLMLLIWNDKDGEWWTLQELMQRIGDPFAALDAMATLTDAGLIHREGDWVFPTRAARGYHHLFG